MNNHQDPPRFALRFFRWFCSDRQLEVMEGDLYELFEYRMKTSTPGKAKLFFLLDVLDLVRPFVWRKPQNHNHFPMVKNYLKIALRSFKQQKVYSTINILGLSIGITCSLLIYLYIQDELSYDSMHSKSDRTYRVSERFQSEGVGEHSASNPFGLGPAMVLEYPHLIEHSVRLFNFQAPSLSLSNESNQQEFNEGRLFLVDSTFFEVFDFELVVGNKETALDGPNSLLITESMASKYFGEENPLGKELKFQGTHTLLVKGILKDAPLNSHFQFDGLISFSTVKSILPASWLTRFYWNPCWTYLTLKDNHLKPDLEDQLPNFVQKYFPERKRDHVTLGLQPLRDIHLKSKLDYEIKANGNENNIYLFGSIAFFVLLIASINFVNLSTARATKRAKEVGVRKTLGSRRTQLIYQFIVEAIIYTFISASLAFLLVFLALPAFNDFTEKSISFSTLLSFKFITLSLLSMVAIGFFSGLYPAFVLSSFKAIKVLKGGQLKVGGLMFRRVLVTAQFMVSILLIIGTVTIVKQLDLLLDDDLGFQKDLVLMVPAARTPVGEHFEVLRQEMISKTDIVSVTAVEEIVGSKNQVGTYHFEGMDQPAPFPRLTVRLDFIETLGMEIVAGRDYDRKISSDEKFGLLVNEALVKSMGWSSNEEAVGKTFKRRDGIGRIIGVVKDFNYASKHMPIAPLVMDLDLRADAFNLFIKYLAVRITGNNLPETLGSMRDVWKGLIPDRPFEYFFLDSRLAQSYKAEEKLSTLTLIFSGLAVMVACLGLFGLVTFITEQRTKEIGIRKVLGIKPMQILSLLSRDFILLILIAFIITIPLAIYVQNQWLSEFAYRVPIEVSPFLMAGTVVLIVSSLTVGLRGLRAIYINPARILKDE